jgi:hypothetical protein
MRSARFVCLFAILISMLVVAQSDRAPVGNQPSGLPIAQPRHPALPPNLSQMPQGPAFAERGTGAFKAAGTRLRTSLCRGPSLLLPWTTALVGTEPLRLQWRM